MPEASYASCSIAAVFRSLRALAWPSLWARADPLPPIIGASLNFCQLGLVLMTCSKYGKICRCSFRPSVSLLVTDASQPSVDQTTLECYETMIRWKVPTGVLPEDRTEPVAVYISRSETNDSLSRPFTCSIHHNLEAPLQDDQMLVSCLSLHAAAMLPGCLFGEFVCICRRPCP